MQRKPEQGLECPQSSPRITRTPAAEAQAPRAGRVSGERRGAAARSRCGSGAANAPARRSQPTRRPPRAGSGSDGPARFPSLPLPGPGTCPLPDPPQDAAATRKRKPTRGPTATGSASSHDGSGNFPFRCLGGSGAAAAQPSAAGGAPAAVQRGRSRTRSGGAGMAGAAGCGGEEGDAKEEAANQCGACWERARPNGRARC